MSQMDTESTQNTSQNESKHMETRIEDLKWGIGLFAGVLSLLVAGLSIMVGLNLSSEKSSLDTLKNELRTEVREYLGKSSKPNLVLMGVDGRELQGETVDAWLAPNEKGAQIHFSWVIKNVGKGRSGKIFARFYSSNVLFPDPDVEGTGYKFSTFIEPSKFQPSEVFGGASVLYTANLGVDESMQSLDSKPEILVRLFYGDGQSVDAKFRVRQKK
jgi:hypothetical protein